MQATSFCSARPLLSHPTSSRSESRTRPCLSRSRSPSSSSRWRRVSAMSAIFLLESSLSSWSQSRILSNRSGLRSRPRLWTPWWRLPSQRCWTTSTKSASCVALRGFRTLSISCLCP
eukprot:Amastigsp_a508627_82.p5 type:complete len:117 gc:universal Amastigsp_a508627_82:2132-1782(-)